MGGSIFEEMRAACFPNFVKDSKSQNQEEPPIPNKINGEDQLIKA